MINSEKKILLLEQYSRLGGAELVALGFLDAVPGRVSIHGVLPAPGPLSKEIEKRGGLLYYHTFPPIRGSKKEKNRSLEFLSKLVDEISPDLIYSPMIRAGYYGSNLSSIADIPFIWHLNEIISPLKVLYLKNSLKSENVMLVSVSRAVARSFFPHKSILLQNAIFEEPGKASLDLTKWGYIGRLVPQKGIHLILKAFELFKAKHPEAILTIFGEESNPGDIHAKKIRRAAREIGIEGVWTSYEQLLKDYVSIHGIKDVKFSGYCEDNKAIFKNIGLFFSPSWKTPKEAFGLSSLEALFSGAIVISSGSGNLKNIILDGETGFVDDLKDPRRTLKRIEDFMGSPNEIEVIRKNGIEFSRKYTVDSFQKKVKDIISEVLRD